MEKAETVIFAICDPFGCAQDKFTIDYFSVVSVISVAMTHFEKTNPILRLRSGQVFYRSVFSVLRSADCVRMMYEMENQPLTVRLVGVKVSLDSDFWSWLCFVIS
jgi:hypothetical protein